MNSKDARAKVDKLEGEMRDLRALDNQRWEVQDVAHLNRILSALRAREAARCHSLAAAVAAHERPAEQPKRQAQEGSSS